MVKKDRVSRASCADVGAAVAAHVQLVPLANTKVIHLIRHAQGFHNVAGELDRANYKSPEYEDAHLTAMGWAQTEALQQHVAARKEQLGVELIVVSPMTRTLETAAGVFGCAPRSAAATTGSRGTFMRSTQAAENKCMERGEIAAPDDCPPVVACELCREQLGGNPCDKRRPISHQREAFPVVDFSEVECDEDEPWEAYGPGRRESVAQIQARALAFLQWLEKRPERAIAVVAHSAFLTLGLLPLFVGHPGYAPEMSDAMGRYFQNCEMRSYVMTAANAPPADGAAPDPLAFPGGKRALEGAGGSGFAAGAQ